VPRLSLRTVESVARKLARNLEPGSRSRAQNFSLFRGVPFQLYPFTAPAVSPETMRRWKIKTSITSGTVTTTEAAACAP
jgi:hypothetical protein